MLRFRTAGASHDGLVRSNNEDAGFFGPYLLLVADGVGGSAAGEGASASAAYVVTSAATMTEGDPLQILADSIQLAHDHLAQGCADDDGLQGMSTTLSAILSDGERVALVHIGDSRAYRWRDGALTQLTRDHTLVQALLDDGQLTVEQAASFPYRSIVTQALNGDHQPRPDLDWIDVLPGDRLLVCSDGLTDLVEDSMINSVLTASVNGSPDLAAAQGEEIRDGDRTDLETAVNTLIAAALAEGGRDNITCTLAEVTTGPRIRPYGQTLGAFSPSNLIDGAAVRLVHHHGHTAVRLDRT